jgi:O-antigen ligase
MIESHPVAGVGFGSFEEIFERYKESYLSTGFKRSAHNTYLRVAAETGIIGFSALVVFLVSLLRTVLHGIRLTRRTPFEVMFLSVAFSLGTFLLMSATLDQMFEPHFWVMVGIALAYGSFLKRLLGSNDIHRSDHAHA